MAPLAAWDDELGQQDYIDLGFIKIVATAVRVTEAGAVVATREAAGPVGVTVAKAVGSVARHAEAIEVKVREADAAQVEVE